MHIGALPLLIVAALVTIQCSPLRDGIVPASADRRVSPDAFSIALISDMPYSDRQIRLFEKLIREVNADPTIDLILHAGDIKGSGPCDDRLYRDRLELYNKFDKPLIYTIGDNEWTDCHREDNGRYYPLERLAFLRTVLFADPTQSIGGRPIPVRSQSAISGFETFVEHAVVLHKKIVFGTLHVVGSNNDLNPWSGFDPSDTIDQPRQDRIEEFRAREAAVLHWLNEIFDLARKTESPGILILIQADPRFELDRHEGGRAGFNGFIDALRELTIEYGKPVLLAHGHKHYLWIDKPLYRTVADGQRERVETLTRIQAPGSPLVRWVKVTVDPLSPEVFLLVDPFVFRQDSLPW